MFFFKYIYIYDYLQYFLNISIKNNWDTIIDGYPGQTTIEYCFELQNTHVLDWALRIFISISI